MSTDSARVKQAAASGAANGLLLKVNQVSALTEALEALQKSRAASWKVIASARSGETEDGWLADLSGCWSTEHIKIG